MIERLLETIITHLKKNLPEIKQIKSGPVGSANALPSIALESAQIEFYKTVKNTSINQRSPQAIIQTLQEFRQEMLVDIYDTERASLEKWTSLTAGIILSDNDDIIKACNHRATESPYQSEPLTITHLIDHIQLIEGIPSASESPFQWQLKFKVSGHLKLSKNIGDVGVIEKVMIDQK
jgi:hypothetical protein